MWIIPKHLPIYRYVQDTKALGVDSEKFSRMCEISLMWRSKPSQSQTWLRRWKRVSYIQHLSTRTLKPSHTKSFVEKWTSSLRDSHANLSHRLVAELPQTILDTFIPTLQGESRSADQLMLFSKMSKGLSVAEPGMGSRYSSMSSEIWKKEVIEHRGEYSLRLKLALHTSGRESLSWPTARLSDGEGGRIETVLNKTGFKSKRKASNQYFGAKLRDAVETYEEKNWRTPTQMDAQNKDRFDYALRLLGGKVIRHSGESVQITLGDHVTMEELRNHPDLDTLINNVSIMKQRTRLPEQRDFVDYIRGQSSIKELDNKTDIKKSTIEHWFRYDTSGFSYPSIEDWYTIKPFLSDIRFNDELIYEEVIEWKPKSWATPNTMDHLKLRSEEALKRQATTTRKGRTSPSNLREQVDPRSVEIYEETKWTECKESSTDCKEKSWPTASSRDWKDTIGMSKTRKDRKGLGRIDQLARAVYHNHGLQDRDKSSTNGKSQESSGKLNPNFVEQMMGLPVGWTQLPIEWID